MSSTNSLRSILPIAGLACGALICSSALASVPLTVATYSGLDNSPPAFPGLYWNLSSGLSNPVIDNAGNIAVSGTIFGDGIVATNNKVIWYGGASGWTVVARSGTPALNLARLTFTSLNTSNSPALSSNGLLSIGGVVAGTGVTTANDTAAWYGPVGSPSLFAREGTTIAPGTGGAVMSSSFNGLGLANSFRANNAGQVLFSSNLAGGSPAVTSANNFGVYIASSSGVTEVWRKGNPIPGAPALPDTSGPFMTPDSFGFFMNGSGAVAHTGTLVAGSAGGVTTNDDKILYTTVGGPMRIVAREGQTVVVPGITNPGVTEVKYKATSSFSLATMGLTNGGKIIYNATLDNVVGTTISAANDNVWLIDDHGTVSLLVQEGQNLGGEPLNALQSAGGMFLTNSDRVVMNGFTGSSGRLWTGPLGGPYTKVVEQGVTTAPGLPDVILNYSPGSGNPAVNSAGQIIFSSNLTGPGVTVGLDDTAIFGWDPTNGLVMIARIGGSVVPQLLDIAQIALIGSTGFTGENGSAILTDNGWLTFRLQDVKGYQAIIRCRPFNVPCPADVNGSGSVDVNDLLAVITAWGVCPNPSNCPADTDHNGSVDVNDLLAVITTWGACP